MENLRKGITGLATASKLFKYINKCNRLYREAGKEFLEWLTGIELKKWEGIMSHMSKVLSHLTGAIMKFSKISMIAFFVCLLTMPAHAIKAEKLTLKNNMTVIYEKLPPNADSIKEAFSEGMLYGRLRMNTFYWDWDKEDYETELEEN